MRLWDLAQIAVPESREQTNILDAALMSLVDQKEADFFPNPWGGGIVLNDVGKAVRGAASVSGVLLENKISASVAITHGTFGKVFNVTGWNTQSLALNIAARMAFCPEAKGRISVSQEVRDLALQCGEFTDGSFLGPLRGEVKSSSFEYYTIQERTIDAVHIDPIVQPSDSKVGIIYANVLVVDIERYSQKSSKEQGISIDALNKCLELTITETGAQLKMFGPAGDGGYFVFPSELNDSTPFTLGFAHKLLVHARSAGLAIRTGISDGVVISTRIRPGVGPTILKADAISQAAPSSGMALPIKLWDDLDERFRRGWSSIRRTDELVLLDVESAQPKPLDPIPAEPLKVIAQQPSTGRLRISLVSLAIVVAVAGVILALKLSGPPAAAGSLNVENAGFIASGFMGDITALRTEVSTENPHSGPTCEKWNYRPSNGADSWAAVAWQFPANNFGDVPGKNWSEQRFRQISVWARGVKDSKGNLPFVQFKAGGNTDPAKRNQASFEVSGDFVTLSEDWKQYLLDVQGKDLSQVIAAFVIVVRRQDVGPEGATFYLDDIEYR